MYRFPLALAATLLVAAVFAAEQHPRMFLTPERLATMRKAVAVKDSTHALAYADMQARLAEPDIAKAYGDNVGYRVGYKAVEAAFMSALVEDAAQQKAYADQAYTNMMSWKGGSATLGKSMEARCMAFAYDWAYPAWTEAQRTAMRTRLEGASKALEGISHSNLGGDRSSNFVGVIRGAELLARLAIGADLKDARVQTLVGELKRHLQHFGSLGVTQEGPGYTEYPGGFLLPCVLATKELGDDTLIKETEKHAFWKLAMYSRTFQPIYNHALMWGVGHGSNNCEGWTSLQLALCPADQLPYYVYFYDRHMGRLVTGSPQHRFDSDRHGTVWALLFYPGDVQAKDPTGVFPRAVADSRGDIFFRNRWKDADDVLASIGAQAKKDEKGWNQPEEMAINLMGFGSRFIGGPAKDGNEKNLGLYSSLLIDGKYSYRGADNPMGKVLAFEPGKAGGYAIVQGGKMFEVVGAKEAIRHMLVEFLPDGQAIVATLDRVKGNGEHTYTWQAAVGHPGPLTWVPEWAPGHEPIDAADNIKISGAAEAGVPTFLWSGRNAGFTKGWMLTPAGATVKAGDPTQVSVKATNADILVVMFVGTGDVPTATVKDGALTVAGRTVSLDAAAGKIVCK
jgi:hypothetical protein